MILPAGTLIGDNSNNLHCRIEISPEITFLTFLSGATVSAGIFFSFQTVAEVGQDCDSVLVSHGVLMVQIESSRETIVPRKKETLGGIRRN